MSKTLATFVVLLAVAFRECPSPAIKMPVGHAMPGGDPMGLRRRSRDCQRACVMNDGFRQMAVAPGVS